jgi:hypothetical protein
MSDEKKVVEMAKENNTIETTKRELSDEARAFINNATISIIKDVIKDPAEYNSCLCSIGVNINSETKEFDSAIISIFNVPQSTIAFVPVLQVVLDLAKKTIAGQNNFVAPVVFRKDEHGNEVEAVLLGRNGDIGIASANVVAEIMASVPVDEPAPAEEATADTAEHVDAEVVE